MHAWQISSSKGLKSAAVQFVSLSVELCHFEPRSFFFAIKTNVEQLYHTILYSTWSLLENISYARTFLFAAQLLFLACIKVIRTCELWTNKTSHKSSIKTRQLLICLQSIIWVRKTQEQISFIRKVADIGNDRRIRGALNNYWILISCHCQKCVSV